jgi:NAD(P)-dependent dehydrogenase (short-subunit alcohol dehydrogenase family)
MTAQSQKVWFITGASSGFGRALAEAALAKGDRVVLAARRREALDALAAAHPQTALALPLDVTDAAARAAAVQAAIARFGRIDVLANIAGRGSLGAAEEFSDIELRGQMELNFFAAAELTRLILPHMRAAGAGHILNLTSIGGVISASGFAAYCASKFALEGWSEALRDEVAGFGIKVSLIEPGAFRTEFAGDANLRPAQPIDAYRPLIQPVQDYLYGNAGLQPGDPAKAAAAMIAVVESETPPLRLLLGADAYDAWEAKRDAREAEFAGWRALGEATAFEGSQVLGIPGVA